MIVDSCSCVEFILIGCDVDVLGSGISGGKLCINSNDVVHFIGATELFSVGILVIVGPTPDNVGLGCAIPMNENSSSLWPFIDEYHRHSHTYRIVVGG